MTLEEFLTRLADVIVNPLIRLLFAAAVIWFVWGVVVYIRSASSDSGRETGAKHIMWGIVGMVIMVSVYAIIEIALNTVF